MKTLILRFLLVGVVFCPALASQALAQTAIENTAAVRVFVEEPYFCLTFVGAPNREDGASKAYAVGADSALGSLLQANSNLSIRDAFAFIQRQCDAKLKGATPKLKLGHPPTEEAAKIAVLTMGFSNPASPLQLG